MSGIKRLLKTAIPMYALERLIEIRSKLKCANEYIKFVVGRHGIEVGGPSDLFRYSIPVYRCASLVDGINFAKETIWEGSIDQKRGYRYYVGKQGTQYIGEASEMEMIDDRAYDFVISCNCLEHVANPLKALTEWRRITKAGGYILLALPRKEGNFDHKRRTTSFGHLVDDFINDTTEHDLTHFDEIMEFHDVNLDPGFVNLEQFRARSKSNFENRCLHHHVFDAESIKKMFEFVGISMVRQDVSVSTNKYIALGRKEA
jgi:ubiquinone/menaquinone biosynthesis C-methylase UbiE